MPAASSTSDQNQQSFRANLSQFRWARGTTDDSANAAPSSTTSTTTSNGNGNPFSRFYNAVAGDYMPLRSGAGEAQEEPGWFALSRWERCVLCVTPLVGYDVCVLTRVVVVGGRVGS